VSTTLRSVYSPPAELGPYTPVGAPMPNLAFLWASMVADGPSCDAVTNVQHLPYRDGVLHIHFLTQAAFLEWADWLGLGWRQEPKGSSLLLGARGSVTRDGRTATVELHCTIGASEVPA